MGWGRMFLLGNVGQQMDIEDIKDYLNRAIEEINKGEEVNEHQGRQIARLTKENQELRLYVLGLMRVLKHKGMLTEGELASVVSAVEGVAGRK